MYFGDPVDADFQPYVSMVPPSKVLQWKQTLTETKTLDTRPKYPKRCKEKYQKNLFRPSFKPDLANCGRLTKIDFTHWRQRVSTMRNVFYWSTGRAMHLGWTWAFNMLTVLKFGRQHTKAPLAGAIGGRHRSISLRESGNSCLRFFAKGWIWEISQ